MHAACEETDPHAMCVCDWQLLAVMIALTLLIIGYGEIEGRRRSRSSPLSTQCHPTAHSSPENPAPGTGPPDEPSTEPFRSHSGEIT
ncbi:MAG TPA: hypothetical protein VGD71_34180 [Kribbella sp.]